MTAVGVVAAGCANEGDRPPLADAPGRLSTATGRARSPDVPPDAAVVEAYVAALAAAEIDAAIALRCARARPEGAGRRAFRSDLERLTDSLGAPAVEQVVENHPPTGLAPFGQAANDPQRTGWRQDLDAVELSYWLSFGGVAIEDPLITVVIEEHGQRRLCGGATHVAKDVYELLGDGVADLGPATPDELSALMPSGLGEGYEQFQDEAYVPEHLPGAVAGWTRAWQAPVYGGGRVTATRFDSADAALRGATQLAQDHATGAIGVFDVPGLNGAQGVRVSGLAGLLIHPTGQPPYVDHAFLVFGDVVVDVGVTVLETGSDHRKVIRLANEVAHLAFG